MMQTGSAAEHMRSNDQNDQNGDELDEAPELVLEEDGSANDSPFEEKKILHMDTSPEQSATNELTSDADLLHANFEIEPHPSQSADQQFTTGVHYIKADHNHYLGAKWFHKAGTQGHAKAQFYLGLMYIKGDGVPKSFYHAYSWLCMAACQNHDEAKTARKNLESYMNANEIAKAQKLAADRIERIFED